MMYLLPAAWSIFVEVAGLGKHFHFMWLLGTDVWYVIQMPWPTARGCRVKLTRVVNRLRRLLRKPQGVKRKSRN